MTVIKNFLIGIVLGIANVIPGVSAGTMAIILGVYDKLLAALSLKLRVIKQNFFMFVMLGLGMIAGIVLLSGTVSYLISTFPMPTMFFFTGVVIGSIPMLFQKAKPRGERLKKRNLLPFVLTLAVMLVMFIIEPQESAQIIRILDLKSGFYLTFLGAIAAFTMIIPGISGSFVLLVLGGYLTVITAVSERNLLILAPVALGVVIGLLLGGRLVSYLMRRFPQATYMAILGLVIGSIPMLLPNIVWNWGLLFSALTFVLGLIIAFFGGKTGGQQEEISQDV